MRSDSNNSLRDGATGRVRRGVGERPLRVLYVEANEDGTVGGSHQALFDLVRSVPGDRVDPIVLFYQDNPFVGRLRDAGISVSVYDRVRTRERAINATRGVVRRRLEQVSAIGRRFRLLRQERVDLVHLNNGPTVGADDWLPAALLGSIPCVVNAMGLPFEEKDPVRRALSRRFARVIAISDYMAATLREQGFPLSQIAQVDLSVDLDRVRASVSQSRAEVRAALAIPEAAIVVTMVGNIRRWKGQHVLLAALERVRSDVRGQMTVLFVGAVSDGDRDYAAELRDTAARAGLTNAVKFLGARGDVPDLLAASDIAVHALTLPEPFGLVVVEAMALGTPVVATRIGGPAQIITPESGLLFDPESPQTLADHLSDLAANPKRRATLGSAARLRAERFGLARHVDEMMRVYDQVIGPGRRPR